LAVLNGWALFLPLDANVNKDLYEKFLTKDTKWEKWVFVRNLCLNITKRQLTTILDPLLRDLCVLCELGENFSFFFVFGKAKRIVRAIYS